MNEPDHRPTGPPEPARGGNGRYTRSTETAELDARAARLRTRGLTYRQIAKELGYADHTSAIDAVRRALREIVEEPAEDLRRLETERLDAALARVNEVIDNIHYVTSSKGDVIEYQGSPLVDDGPILAAALAIVRIGESRRKLLGLDAEAKVNVSGGVRYEVVGVDPGDIVGAGGETDGTAGNE